MTGIVSREFEVLASHGQNYLTWVSNVQIVLGGKKLKVAIGLGQKDEVATDEQNDQALHFLQHHLSPTLKNEYMSERKASNLWNALQQRFERLKYTVLPQAQQDWARLRYADFKTVGEYNAALHRICTKLSLCGKVITDEEKIEKTLSTFHPSAIQSARNYRQDAYKQYSDLIDMMQVNEAQDDALKTNFNAYPNGKSISTEVNVASYKIRKPIHRKRGKHGAGKGKKETTVNPINAHRKKTSKEKPQHKPYGLQDQTCYKCGVWGHWSKICQSPKHVIEAYKAKNISKQKPEAHFTMATNNEAMEEDPTLEASGMPLDLAVL
jgi:hypothetical protein